MSSDQFKKDEMWCYICGITWSTDTCDECRTVYLSYEKYVKLSEEILQAEKEYFKICDANQEYLENRRTKR